MTIALHPVEDPSHFGVVPTHGTDGSSRSSRSPRPDEAPTNHINAGTYVFEPRALIASPRRSRQRRARDLPGVRAAGNSSPWLTSAYWLDTGTPRPICRPTSTS